MRSFWPAGEPAQIDYESLRAAVVGASGLPADLAAARFLRRGLAGLVAWPVSEPAFSACLVTARDRGWSGRVDPVRVALAEGYGLVLSTLEDGLSGEQREIRA